MPANSDFWIMRPLNTLFLLVFAAFLLLLTVASLILKNKSERTRQTVLVTACVLTFIGFFFYKYFLSLDSDYDVITANMGGFNCDYITHNENAVRMRRNTEAAYDIPLFPTVSVGWDDTPRFPAKGAQHVTRFNHTPQVFATYLKVAKDYADAHRDTQPPFIMINAWNEWVEGSYLLPDHLTGFGYLEAVRDVLQGKYD